MDNNGRDKIVKWKLKTKCSNADRKMSRKSMSFNVITSLGGCHHLDKMLFCIMLWWAMMHFISLIQIMADKTIYFIHGFVLL